MMDSGMNENTVQAGIQLFEGGAQLTWQYGKMVEPQTLSLPGERSDGNIDVPQKVIRQFLAGQPFRGPEKDSGLSEGAKYLKTLLDLLPQEKGKKRELLRICVTVPNLTENMARNLQQVFRELGISERQVFLQDFRTSFFYYVVNKKKELWNGDVAFLTMRDQQMKGYVLHFDRNVSPHTAQFHEAASVDVSEKVRAGRSDEDWDMERDRLLYELLGKLFERRNVTASYLYGTYFDASWAKRSFQYLTFHRHAFQGQNLFSKGACYGAMARTGLIRMPDIVFLGIDMVRENIGMMVRVKGRMQYLPLIKAGVNWYEAYGNCEVIPDGEKCVTLLSSVDGETEQARHVVRLDHFPVRPERASRLRIAVWFSGRGRLEAEIRDLGFGSMYPSSGQVWRRSIKREEN